jgi:hypothetical protein
VNTNLFFLQRQPRENYRPFYVESWVQGCPTNLYNGKKIKYKRMLLSERQPRENNRFFVSEIRRRGVQNLYNDGLLQTARRTKIVKTKTFPLGQTEQRELSTFLFQTLGTAVSKKVSKWRASPKRRIVREMVKNVPLGETTPRKYRCFLFRTLNTGCTKTYKTARSSQTEHRRKKR